MQKQGETPRKQRQIIATLKIQSRQTLIQLGKKKQSVNSYIHRNQGLNPKNLNIVPKKQKSI